MSFLPLTYSTLTLTLILFIITIFTTSVHAQDTLTTTLDTAKTIGIEIAPNYVSFSLEHDLALHWVGSQKLGINPKPSFTTLMSQLLLTDKQIGPTFRIGGNSADYSWYNQDGLPTPILPSGPAISYNITDDDISSLSAAMDPINGQLIIGVNFRHADDATWALNHLKAIDRIIGWKNGIIQAIEIGNECDLYNENGIRDKSYDETQYESEFRTYTDAAYATIADIPQHIFQGAVFCCRDNFIEKIPQYVVNFNDRLLTTSVHSYPFTACNNNTVKLSQLLEDSAATEEADYLVNTGGNLIFQSNRQGFPLVIGESNSVSCSGFGGVSNVFGAALWTIDVMYNSAAVGVAQYVWHSHDSDVNHYPPLIWPTVETDVPIVHPGWYALRFFAVATANKGTIVKADVKTTNHYIHTWSVINDQKIITTAVLHKDLSATQNADISVDVTSSLKSPYPTGILIRLTGIATETFGVSFGGFTYDNTTNGMPKGSFTYEKITAQNGIYNFQVSPISAVLLVIDPKDNAVNYLTPMFQHS
jgi:hypothetical protein